MMMTIEYYSTMRAAGVAASAAAGIPPAGVVPRDRAAVEDAAADMYMDAVKADAAYCLGIDEGSDEWYALMEI